MILEIAIKKKTLYSTKEFNFNFFNNLNKKTKKASSFYYDAFFVVLLINNES